MSFLQCQTLGFDEFAAADEARRAAEGEAEAATASTSTCARCRRRPQPRPDRARLLLRGACPRPPRAPAPTGSTTHRSSPRRLR
jgi:hypothetical protein